MKVQTIINNNQFTFEVDKGINISIPLRSGKQNPKAFYAPDPKIDAVVADSFIGDTQQGGLVNFKNVFYNPHGNGTHTECVGHIAKEPYYINECLNRNLFLAELITIEPIEEDGDKIITTSQLRTINWDKSVDALIVRTCPNEASKKTRDYSGSNPPYIHHEAIAYMMANGVHHLLVDLPSVDREEDDGKLLAHKAFWNYPSEEIRKHATITEMIYVPNEIKDGTYLVNIQIAPIELDASSSNVVIYPLL